MEERVTTERLEPKIIETPLWNKSNLMWAFIIGFCFLFLSIILIISFKLTINQSLIIILIVIVFYSVILYFMLEPGVMREVEHTIVHTVERPVIQRVEVPVEVPVEKEVYIERPVEVPVEKEVFVPIMEDRKKLDIPKYDYVGSTETMTYHTRNCRLGKLIKRKYKVQNNYESDLKRRGFKGCKVCIKKLKKI